MHPVQCRPCPTIHPSFPWPLTTLPAPPNNNNTTGILYQDMYARDLSGTHVEMRSLHALVATKLPALHDHLAALRCDMSILATDWFLCLFCTALPAEAAARVWDALLCEGPKVLFRVALALMRGSEPALLAAEDAGALLRAMRDAAADAHDRDRLMHDAFESVGGLPMDRIRRYRERNQREVDHEFAARETRRAGVCGVGGSVGRVFFVAEFTGMRREGGEEMQCCGARAQGTAPGPGNARVACVLPQHVIAATCLDLSMLIVPAMCHPDPHL